VVLLFSISRNSSNSIHTSIKTKPLYNNHTSTERTLFILNYHTSSPPALSKNKTLLEENQHLNHHHQSSTINHQSSSIINHQSSTIITQ